MRTAARYEKRISDVFIYFGCVFTFGSSRATQQRSHIPRCFASLFCCRTESRGNKKSTEHINIISHSASRCLTLRASASVRVPRHPGRAFRIKIERRNESTLTLYTCIMQPRGLKGFKFVSAKSQITLIPGPIM